MVYALSRAIDERRLELKAKSTDNTIISLEEQQLGLLRNLRFKYFFIALLARVLEPVLGAKVDLSTVAFSPSAAKVSNKSIVALVAECLPIVSTLLTYVSAQVPHEKFNELHGQDDPLTSLAGQVSALIYAGQANLPFDAFRALVTAS